MDKADKTGLIVVTILLLSVVVACMIVISLGIERDNACRNAGFKEYTMHGSGMEYCEDNIGNLYLVHSDCEYYSKLIAKKCTIREISINYKK